MRLDEYVEDLERDEDAERRRLVKQKSYAITEFRYLVADERRHHQRFGGCRLHPTTKVVGFRLETL